MNDSGVINVINWCNDAGVFLYTDDAGSRLLESISNFFDSCKHLKDDWRSSLCLSAHIFEWMLESGQIGNSKLGICNYILVVDWPIIRLDCNIEMVELVPYVPGIGMGTNILASIGFSEIATENGYDKMKNFYVRQ